MKSSSLLRLALVLVAALFTTGLLQAQDLAALRARMEKRLSDVNALKNRHVVGENNRGYLEVRGGVLGHEQQIVSEENTDRRKVYAALAAETGAKVDEVGRQRAGQLATLAKRGHWIQEPSGDWRQK
jgi:uncharacterized protein YdbL (DUF1318 family)